MAPPGHPGHALEPRGRMGPHLPDRLRHGLVSGRLAGDAAADELRLRVGLRWTATIPRDRIAAVHKKRPPGSEPYLRASLPGTTPLWIELTEPATAKGPYGIEKRARWISLNVDDPERFRQALAV